MNNEINEYYSLPLRGGCNNKIINASMPLLGMLLRLKDINAEAMPENLYQQVVTDIQSIEQILKEQSYEPGIVISFRYILCTFIDEIALAHGWGSHNNWFSKSLLTHFHNETWGGEKTYILLEKLMLDPKRYQDLLEFVYLCFSLGFRGRYKINNHNSEFEQIYKRLYNLLFTQSSESKNLVVHISEHSEPTKYNLRRKLTLKKILLWGSLCLIAVYTIYYLQLEYQSTKILEQLNNLLN